MILGISRNASDDEVKKAYRALCRKYHPDANINKPNAEEAAAKFTEVQQAYDQIGRSVKMEGAAAGFGGYGTGFGGYKAGRTAAPEDRMSIPCACRRQRTISIPVTSGKLSMFCRAFLRERRSGIISAQWPMRASAIIMQPRSRRRRRRLVDPSNPAYRNLVQQLSYGTYRYDSMSENYGGAAGAWEAAVPILSASAFSVRVSTLSAAADEVSG